MAKVRSGALADALFGKARKAVIGILFSQPERAWHLRELARQAGVSPTMLGKEADTLSAAGIVIDRPDGNRRTLAANADCPIFEELRGIARKTSAQPEVELNTSDPGAGRRRARERPRSLKQVALLGRAPGRLDGLLREFLDEFYVEPNRDARAAMLLEEPPRMDDRADAYLAAVAEHLALQDRLGIPAWTGAKSRFLKRPFFPAGLESLKATLLMESPAAFRRRMIFVGANPLYRPRKDKVGIG
ncbi:MAG TPA: hypothetical protein VH183_02615 [Burkholderiaceae bacterium]|jgi:hypothetical protein|nr:hypothetical protein [Burkholderiaceae bacterium]